MKPLTNQPEPGNRVTPDAQLRVMRILWAAFLVTIGLFFLVTHFSRPDEETVAELRAGDPTILYVMVGLALSTVVASFILKANFYKRAVEGQQPEMLQTGFIIALALCESAVLFGLVAIFITRNDYAYGLFALGALGEALHFPTREQVLSAYYKSNA
jgi:F0F1-type ATP synthase membrane subunit c/vacuolar-type H+-ATPase subunit K